jgi:flagellar operon protein
LSQHAARRLDRRGLEVSSAQAERLVSAIDRAAAKGSRTSLVLLDQLALLVRIPERTVVTAMSPDAMREGVVTRIDSAVMI